MSEQKKTLRQWLEEKEKSYESLNGSVKKRREILRELISRGNEELLAIELNALEESTLSIMLAGFLIDPELARTHEIGLSRGAMNLIKKIRSYLLETPQQKAS